jgi:hypothetical protein
MSEGGGKAVGTAQCCAHDYAFAAGFVQQHIRQGHIRCGASLVVFADLVFQEVLGMPWYCGSSLELR